ncbi:MAG: cold adaptation protein AtcC [Shewanella sp.]
MQLVLRDVDQGPYLTKVLVQGQTDETLSHEQLSQVKSKAMLMSLKLADKFYNKYKMHLLEQAAHDVIGVVSLGLLELSKQDQQQALRLLQSADGIVKCFQKGWSMLSTVSKHKLVNGKSLYGDVDKSLLEQVSSPPDAEEWQGYEAYQDALQEHQRQQSIAALMAQFYGQTQYDPLDFLHLESVLAEAVLYRILFDKSKVKQDLKKRIAKITLLDEWFTLEYIEEQTKLALAELPAELADTIAKDLGKHFVPALLRTLHFAKSYREALLDGASPERLERFEHKEGLIGLLGWPLYLAL